MAYDPQRDRPRHRSDPHQASVVDSLLDGGDRPAAATYPRASCGSRLGRDARISERLDRQAAVFRGNVHPAGRGGRPGGAVVAVEAPEAPEAPEAVKPASGPAGPVLARIPDPRGGVLAWWGLARESRQVLVFGGSLLCPSGGSRPDPPGSSRRMRSSRRADPAGPRSHRRRRRLRWRSKSTPIGRRRR